MTRAHWKHKVNSKPGSVNHRTYVPGRRVVGECLVLVRGFLVLWVARVFLQPTME